MVTRRALRGRRCGLGSDRRRFAGRAATTSALPGRSTEWSLSARQPACLESPQSHAHPLLFPGHLERLAVARPRNHRKNSQRRGNRQPSLRLQDLGGAHHQQAQSEVVTLTGVVQELPRQPGQLWRTDTQHQPQGPTLLLRSLVARARSW